MWCECMYGQINERRGRSKFESEDAGLDTAMNVCVYMYVYRVYVYTHACQASMCILRF